jgi:hypothetical protein
MHCFSLGGQTRQANTDSFLTCFFPKFDKRLGQCRLAFRARAP